METNQSDSSFDPSAYLDAQITEESVRRPNLPGGSEWIAQITDVKVRPWKGKEDPTKTGIAFDVTVKINPSDVPSVAALMPGTDQVLLTDGIMISTVPGSNQIDNSPGKNPRLRQWREALNMNKAGEVFSPRQMIGHSIKVRIKHDLYNGETYDKIDAVSRP